MACSQKDTFGISSCLSVEGEREQNIAKEQRAAVQSTLLTRNNG